MVSAPPRRDRNLFGASLLAFLVVPSLILTAGLGSGAGVGGTTGSSTPQLWVPTVFDGGHVDLMSSGKVLSVLTDRSTFVSSTPYSRTYSISISVSVSYPLMSAHVESFPLTMWGDPMQYPGGVDALPPLSDWSWTVYHGTTNDTANWTTYPAVSTIMRTVAWSAATFTVTGKVFPRYTLQVGAASPTGHVAPGVGYVATDVLAPLANTTTDPDFLQLARGVHPGLIRFGTTSIGMNVTWDSTNHVPVYKWRSLDAILNFSQSLPAPALMSLPVGTWGDGNNLPTNMPLNLSYQVSFFGATGYFPTVNAYSLYIAGIAAHLQSSGENVTYWSIGNEVPRYTVAEVNEYIQLFNAAASTIHKTFPKALVGSDIMMDPKYIRQFALTTHGVGFLSFHYYPATGICMNGGNYCPPQGGALGTTDPTIVDGPNYIGHLALWDAPALAQMIWKNLTGVSPPVIDAETNLNHMGGQYTSSGGTDPRIPTIFAASWLSALLVQSVEQNLTSFLYYGFTGPAVQTPTNTSQYGGWGFQMTSEGTHDNNTRYAPFWALRLWSMGVVPGAAALSTTGADPSVVAAQAFRLGPEGLSVFVVNRVNTTVRLTINVSGMNEVPKALNILGPLSYREVFNPATQTESLLRSSVVKAPVPSSNPVHLTLKGYSVALLRERYVPGVAPSPGTSTPGSPALTAHPAPVRTADTAASRSLVGVVPGGPLTGFAGSTGSSSSIGPGSAPPRGVTSPAGWNAAAILVGPAAPRRAMDGRRSA